MRIYGGTKAPQRKWPWQVSLQSYNTHVCGGSLITNQLVLTAAHCVVGRIRDYKVMLGNNELFQFDENEVVVPVKDIVPHQYYDVQQVTNDIAIALLDFPVNYSSYIQPICLPERPFTVKAETLCWVTGWGRMEGNGMLIGMSGPGGMGDRERAEQVQWSSSLGADLKKSKDDLHIWSNEIADVSREGDSGGPLACEVNNTWIQMGVVSWGYFCGVLPSVYTDVIQYKKWIRDILNQASHIYSMGVSMLLICLMLPEAILVTV
ncbi:putative inactive serine protease 43 [Sciurus carolinensis]|uniref:putative inactive serine protease 43 n=1 Tax=Sciurus carolinensis TaxID=30640 RepID=UPI001FB3EE93|nr:putative inactive serine protease 43 [Sciurus carolinensis]